MSSTINSVWLPVFIGPSNPWNGFLRFFPCISHPSGRPGSFSSLLYFSSQLKISTVHVNPIVVRILPFATFRRASVSVFGFRPAGMAYIKTEIKIWLLLWKICSPLELNGFRPRNNYSLCASIFKYTISDWRSAEVSSVFEAPWVDTWTALRNLYDFCWISNHHLHIIFIWIYFTLSFDFIACFRDRLSLLSARGNLYFYQFRHVNASPSYPKCLF